MKLLTNKKIQTISAGMSQGQINHLGVSYPIKCPLVSQPCLNSYIHYLEFDFANQNELMSALFSAMQVCDGPEGLKEVSTCTKVNLDKIKKGL